MFTKTSYVYKRYVYKTIHNVSYNTVYLIITLKMDQIMMLFVSVDSRHHSQTYLPIALLSVSVYDIAMTNLSPLKLRR